MRESRAGIPIDSEISVWKREHSSKLNRNVSTGFSDERQLLDHGAANQLGLIEGFPIESSYEFRDEIGRFDDVAKK